MSDINPYIGMDGDYLLINGAIQNNNSLISELYFNLNTPLGSYIYDKSLGNELLNLNYAPSITEIKQMITNSISGLVRSQRINNVTIKVLVPLRDAYKVDITAADNTGEPVKFVWNVLDT